MLAADHCSPTVLADATALDVWAFDRLSEVLQNATGDAALDAQLRQPQTVFFLHLLGLDTTGHAYRPHSRVRLYVYSQRLHMAEAGRRST
jgi:hypothetical protein